jgi:hypothetical protein
MANTETRSGFRLPWSSDRAHDNHAGDGSEPTAEDALAQAEQEEQVDGPSGDTNDRLDPPAQSRPADPTHVPTASDAQEPPMIELEPSPSPAPVAPRKPSKLMVDLTAAIRATAIAARDQALVQVDTDVARVIEAIRSGSRDGEGALRVRSDEDVAQIKEWSRAEIARIKEETETRIDARKAGLDGELAAHAAAIEQRVGQVEGTVATYKSELDAYSGRLATEDDPSSLATLAESMPEPPAIEGFADLGDIVVEPMTTPAAEAVVEVEVEAQAEALATAEAVEPEAIAPEISDGSEVEVSDGSEVEVQPTVKAPSAWGDPEAAGGWVRSEDAWGATAVATLEAANDSQAVDDAPRWAAGETPEGFPAATEATSPVDRGAIMAALEAAAEAVVAAESAAESADQAEAAAGVAETAAELLKGRVDDGDEYDPEAQAALSARVGAGGFEESYADRLAALLPSHGDGLADGEPRTTQVIVSGLVSVASIASFKRHLGRLVGVQGVAVASGPDGEFVFNVTHRPDVSFRDAIPTMPGFAARVTGGGDGVVQVTARDPEAEG